MNNININKVRIIEESFNELKSLLSVRSRNVLKNNGIDQLEDFLLWSEHNTSYGFLNFRNCGKKSVLELEEFRKRVTELVSSSSLNSAIMQDKDQLNYDEDLSEEHPSNDDNVVEYLERSLDNWKSGKAKDWIIDVYKNLRNFAVAFMTSPDSVFNHIKTKERVFSYELCTSLSEFFAKTTISCKDIQISKDIENKLRIFVQLIDSNRQTLIENMLLTDNKRNLILTKFIKMSTNLSVRGRHALYSIVDTKDIDSIIAFVNAHQDFLSYNKVGRKSTLELGEFKKNFRLFFAQVLFSENNSAEFHVISENFPFLSKEDILFVSSFYSKKGHLPMFFLAERFFVNNKNAGIQIYRDYYGIGIGYTQTLDDIAANTDYTRERVRQIISSLYKWIFKESSLFTKDKWSNYSFIFGNIITIGTSDFQHIVDTEHINLTFFAFCGIVRLIDYKIIEIYSTKAGNDYCIAYSPLIKGFSIASAIKEIKRLSSTKKDVDLTLSLYDFFANNDIYWSKWWSSGTTPDKDQIDLSYKVLLEVVKGLRIGQVDDKGNLILRANKLNYTEVIYNIIKANGAPMHIDEIRKEFSRLYPNDSHNNATTIRIYIQRDERIESIGRTSTYKLKSWEGFSGSIPQLLVRLLSIKSEPVQSSKLAEEALRYRSDSTLKSISSNINQKVNDGTLCMFYPDFVGLTNKVYGRKYKALPRTFDDFLKAFLDFIDKNKRYPYSSSQGYEGMLYHWYNKSKKLISLSDSEIIIFTKAMKEIEPFHYPHNSTEADFQSICLAYKSFVSSTHHLVSDEDDESMFSWFLKSAKDYMSWDDNRKNYFQDLLNFISHKL